MNKKVFFVTYSDFLDFLDMLATFPGIILSFQSVFVNLISFIHHYINTLTGVEHFEHLMIDEPGKALLGPKLKSKL